MKSCATRIAALGHYVPERRVENSVLEQELGLSHGWIARRTGIRARCWAAPDQALTDIALEAASSALARVTCPRSDRVGSARNLHARSSAAAVRTAARASPRPHLRGDRSHGRMFGVPLCAAACGRVRENHRPIGADRRRQYFGWRIDKVDTTSAVLFADAAGAMVLAPSSREESGLLGSSVMSDGSLYDMIAIEAGGTRNPDLSAARPGDRADQDQGRQDRVQKAVATMTLCSIEALERASVEAAQIDHFIPHQANARIFDLVAENLKLDPRRTLRSIEEFGNSSAATIPLTLSLAAQDGRLADGQLLLMAAVGGASPAAARCFDSRIGDARRSPCGLRSTDRVRCPNRDSRASVQIVRRSATADEAGTVGAAFLAGNMLACCIVMLPFFRLQGEQAATTFSQVVRPAARARDDGRR